MSTRKLQQLYQIRLTSFKRNFDLTRQHHLMEDIHHLRVDIKKLRAMLRLMQVLSPVDDREKSYRKLFSKIFNKAGEVREAQVNMELLKRYELGRYSTYAKRLPLKEREGIVVLLKAMESFNNAQFEVAHAKQIQKVQSLPDDRIETASSSLLIQELRKVVSLKYVKSSDPLHKIRIKLKAIVEIFVLLEEVHRHPHLSVFHQDIKQLNQMLGDWHDQQVLLEEICRYEQEYKDPEVSELDMVKFQIKEKIRVQRAAIKMKLHATVNLKRLRALQDLLERG